MSRFYIKEINASGPDVKYSTISLKDGLNIIYGPSNTGKSYVVKCINFMFGSNNSEIPFTKEDTGYDTVNMVMESDDGYSISMTRKIVDGKDGETGSGTVNIISNFPEVISNSYSVNNYEYSDVLLKLIGIESRHKIVGKQDFDTQNLTIRSIFHLFYIDEENIFKSGSAFDTPKHSKMTASLTALYFLLTGNDLSDRVPEESKEEREKKKVRKEGVVRYLSQKINDLTDRKNKVEGKLAKFSLIVDIDGKIRGFAQEIEEIEKQIVAATEESQELIDKIYKVSSKLEEARYLKDRYAQLQSQYDSDIKRLHFITDGNKRIKAYGRLLTCPFCENEIKEEEQQKSYAESSAAEIARIQYQMEDLQVVEEGVNAKIISMEEELEALSARNDDVTECMAKELRPRAEELREVLEEYKLLTALQQEQRALSDMVEEMKVDIFEEEKEVDEGEIKLNPRDLFDDLWKDLSNDFEKMVHACGYPNAPATRISKESVDAVVGNKKKRNQGKGYRSFLNSVMLFNLMKFMEERARYAPRLLILDSPILSLKEKKYKLDTKDVIPGGMREHLFQYFVWHCGKNQVIIAENEIPETVAYDKANLIEFTKDEEGRYGFLLSERDEES